MFLLDQYHFDIDLTLTPILNNKPSKLLRKNLYKKSVLLDFLLLKKKKKKKKPTKYTIEFKIKFTIYP